MGFEPTRAEPNGLAVHRLNHSATSSGWGTGQLALVKNITHYLNETISEGQGHFLISDVCGIQMDYYHILGF